MKRFMSFLNEEEHGIWYHGSASSDLRGGASGLHLGTHEAAKQALHARIGHPATGSWDGTREYGKTKLAGQHTMKKKKLSVTGHNCRAPDHDYFPHEHPEQHKYPDGSKMPHHVKPSIKAYKITGKMTNTPNTPHNDWKANGYMKAAKKKGTAKRGYYYKNEGEDAGSISAVVPDGSHVKEKTT